MFMHIPKTAGTTLRRVIQKKYQSSELMEFFPKNINSISKEKLNEVKYVYGHNPFGFHTYFSRPFTYITILRDPIDRIISEYYYLVEQPMHDVYISKQIQEKNMNLEDYVTSLDEKIQLRTMNMQTRYASGVDSPKYVDLEKAKENLNKYFSVVGITEMFDESLYFIMKETGRGGVSYQKTNITKRRPKKDDLPKGLIDKIKNTNQLDIELYEWAKANLLRRIKNLDTNSKQSLESFKLKVRQ